MALLFIAAALAGCSGSVKPQPTSSPTAAPTAQNTESGEATEIPEWMWTPDPALFILGEDGFFEDDYLSAYWPAYLEYQYSIASNCAQYMGYPEGSEKKLLFSYLPDEGGIYADEIAVHDRDSYEALLQEKGAPYYVKEFAKTKVDGHDALRIVFDYVDPEKPEHYVKTLQYLINVNGWILQLLFSTQDTTIPEECINSVNTIKFKPGY